MQKMMLQTAVLLAVVTSGAPAASEQSSPPAPSYSFPDRADGARGTVVRAYYRTTVEKAWKVLSSLKMAPRIFGTVKRIDQNKGQPGLWTYRLEYPIGERAVVCKVQRNKAKGRISWKRSSGDFLVFEGGFKVAASTMYPGFVEVRFRSFLNPGGMARVLLTERRRRGQAEDMVTKLRSLL